MTLNDFEYLIPIKAEVQIYDYTSNSHVFTGASYKLSDIFKNMPIKEFKVFVNKENFIYRFWI